MATFSPVSTRWPSTTLPYVPLPSSFRVMYLFMISPITETHATGSTWCQRERLVSENHLMSIRNQLMSVRPLVVNENPCCQWEPPDVSENHLWSVRTTWYQLEPLNVCENHLMSMRTTCWQWRLLYVTVKPLMSGLWLMVFSNVSSLAMKLKTFQQEILTCNSEYGYLIVFQRSFFRRSIVI